ncbi:MAG: hypothetical protein Kow0037_21400 [Calditrichia bacterium]
MKACYFYFTLLIVLLFTLSCQNSAKQTATVKDGLFIHISHGSDDPHRLLMALKMAEIVSAEKDVLVYCDIKAIDAVVKDGPDISLPPFPNSRAQLKKLVDMGITVMACPTCLKVAGKTPEDLLEGVEIANKDKFFSFTKGRILSIDY